MHVSSASPWDRPPCQPGSNAWEDKDSNGLFAKEWGKSLTLFDKRSHGGRRIHPFVKSRSTANGNGEF